MQLRVDRACGDSHTVYTVRLDGRLVHLCEADRLIDQITWTQLWELLELLGDDLLTEDVQNGIQGRAHERQGRVLERHKIAIFDRLKDHNLRGVKDMTEAATATEAKPGRSAKYPHEAKIALQKDADGKIYGPDNNPKRAGSKTHERFKLYKTGMSVGDFLKAGGQMADISYDVDKGFIKVG